ncbi:uncharacterized protein LOC141646795 [Silene latifolia]|uniref:uncharacterized protein LOC141646795 n=1 Tax=Silene latifolia TaxID=37657 RepID=UPI003D76E463
MAARVFSGFLSMLGLLGLQLSAVRLECQACQSQAGKFTGGWPVFSTGAYLDKLIDLTDASAIPTRWMTFQDIGIMSPCSVCGMVHLFWLADGIASFLPEGLFDHSPCIIRLWDEIDRKPSCFKYFNMWGKDDRFKSTVMDVWQQQIKGCKSFQVVKKLKLLKFPLRQLKKEGFGDIINTAKVAQLLLEDIQKKLHQDPHNVSLQTEERAAAKSYKELNEARNMFLNKKAKVQWMKCNDENSHYFHSSIKARRALNKILSIKDQFGVLCSDNKAIEDAFLTYYKDLLGSSKDVVRVNLGVVRRGKCVNHQQATGMIQRVSDAEIKEALFAIPIDKAPGSDGYTSCFFKDSFDITGSDVIQAVHEFFENGKLLE